MIFVALAAMATWTVGCSNSIRELRGTVVSLRTGKDQETVCMKNDNVGSIYHECVSGNLVGYRPKPGDCVFLTVHGERPDLVIHRVTGC